MAGGLHKTANLKTVFQLGVLAVLMFVFALWVMPPLYVLFCEVTGLNGKTDGPYTAVEAQVDTSRSVKVQFVATNNESMPWEFRPTNHEIKVHPGEATTITYYAKNPTDKAMWAQAIPSLVPYNAANYFHKTECFCFNQQELAPGEEAQLALQFIVDQDLPSQVNTITLSYTLFDITAEQLANTPSSPAASVQQLTAR